MLVFVPTSCYPRILTSYLFISRANYRLKLHYVSNSCACDNELNSYLLCYITNICL
uniref:Uncharacterized protein n=1 Tax=Anguilla anguilla TaxID=7936 RepID=A0A0E9W265_ANGAN